MSAAILVVLMSAINPQLQTKVIEMRTQPDEMKREIQEVIPVGTRVEDAREIMELNGFSCETMVDAAFVEYDDEGRQIVHERKDFDLCEKRKEIDPFVIREWVVILVQREGRVADTFVNIFLTGV